MEAPASVPQQNAKHAEFRYHAPLPFQPPLGLLNLRYAGRCSRNDIRSAAHKSKFHKLARGTKEGSGSVFLTHHKAQGRSQTHGPPTEYSFTFHGDGALEVSQGLFAAFEAFCVQDQSVNREYEWFHYFDSIRVNFLDFLWGQYFVQPSASMLLLKGMAFLKATCLLEDAGWMDPHSDEDKRRAIGEFITSSSLAMKVVGVDKQCAHFCFPQPIVVTDDAKIHTYRDLRATVDNRSHRLITATLVLNDDSEIMLSATDALVLVVSYAGLILHPQIHSQANFAVDLDHSDKFLKKKSVVTALFNSYGNTNTWLFPWGLPVNDGSFQKQIFDHANRLGVGPEPGNTPCPHSPHLQALSQHSPYVRWVLSCRASFMQIMRKPEHRKLLRNIDVDAMFQEMVMHSLDHAQFANLIDPRMIDRYKTQFPSMAVGAQISRAGFTERLPGLLFPTLLKDVKHPLYRQLYAAAKELDEKLNQHFADEIECCVVR